MPSRNVVKSFAEDQMWHVYNRGVDKRIIFADEKDYAVFLSYLKYCLSKEEDDKQKLPVADETEADLPNRINLHDEVKLVSFCLMPNHFHLQLYQLSKDGISKLMQSIMVGYVLYFNRRHNRQGALFQGKYKASHVYSDEYWEHLSRYIHLNPLDVGENYARYAYSSYKYFDGQYKTPEWLCSELALESFATKKDYVKFCEDYIPYRSDLKEIKYFLADI